MLSVQSSYLHSNYNHYHVRSSQRQGTRKTVLDCGILLDVKDYLLLCDTVFLTFYTRYTRKKRIMMRTTKLTGHFRITLLIKKILVPTSVLN